MTDPRKLRVFLLCEDNLTERFFRGLLDAFGFERRRVTVVPRPKKGTGAAEAWVRVKYPDYVEQLRRKNYQAGLWVIAVRDGDNRGVQARKQELDDALAKRSMARRAPEEHIATPVPSWSIETWLLWLLDKPSISEASSYKRDFKSLAGDEGKLVQAAVSAWPGPAQDGLPGPALRVNNSPSGCGRSSLRPKRRPRGRSSPRGVTISSGGEKRW